MPALLAIAAGAVNVGKKIFDGIKNRKDKKIEKKAAALVAAQEGKANVENKYGALFASMGGGNGAQTISGSGNFLAGIKNAFSPNPAVSNFQPVSGAMAVQKQNADAAQAQGGGMNPMLLLLGGALVLLFIFKKR